MAHNFLLSWRSIGEAALVWPGVASSRFWPQIWPVSPPFLLLCHFSTVSIAFFWSSAGITNRKSAYTGNLELIQIIQLHFQFSDYPWSYSTALKPLYYHPVDKQSCLPWRMQPFYSVCQKYVAFHIFKSGFSLICGMLFVPYVVPSAITARIAWCNNKGLVMQLCSAHRPNSENVMILEWWKNTKNTTDKTKMLSLIMAQI